MDERFSEEGVRRRVAALRLFHRHAMVFVVTASVALVLGLTAEGSEGWTWWPLGAWGAVLAGHAAQVFGPARRGRGEAERG
jgi:hypothetical protein